MQYNLLEYCCNIISFIISHPFNLFIINSFHKLASCEGTYLNLFADRTLLHVRKIKSHEENDNYSETGSKISLMASYNSIYFGFVEHDKCWENQEIVIWFQIAVDGHNARST